MPRAREYLDLLRNRLPEKTVKHAVSVTALMVRLSTMLSFERDHALQAGLLHDLHKKTPPKYLLELAEQYGLDMPLSYREKPKLLHGPVAAEECRRNLDIDDAVYEAIYWHTTGRPGLGPVGQALFFADFAEPLRSNPEAGEARRLLDAEGFQPALRYVAESKLNYVLMKPPVDPTTQAFTDWLRSKDGAMAQDEKA
jgi:predicted HD superfamily hydrolase involved in NAD metabolism